MNESLHQINQFISRIGAAYRNALLKMDISDSAMQILYVLTTNNVPLSQSDICRRNGQSKQTVNSTIRKLEHEGIIRLEKINGKTQMIHMTDYGRSYVESHIQPMIDAENALILEWPEEDCKTFCRLLEKYLSDLERKLE